MSVSTASRRRPVPIRYEPTAWQARLIDDLRTRPPFADAVRRLRDAWRQHGEPELRVPARRVTWKGEAHWWVPTRRVTRKGTADRLVLARRVRRKGKSVRAVPAGRTDPAYNAMLEAEAVRLRLTVRGRAARWAVEALDREVRGVAHHHRPERMPMPAQDAVLEVSVGSGGATIDLELERLLIDPSEPHQGTSRHWRIKGDTPLGFEEWEALRAKAHAALDLAIDRMRDVHRADPSLRFRNSGPEKDRERDCHALALVLAGATGAKLSRDRKRHLCELLQLDPPR